MDAPTNTKSGGLKFAEHLMQRQGWSEGKGLGKREDGISEAIKVKVKCDTAGVGHNSAEQFTFHWWDHVFNKTASSISVEPDQDGVKVKKLSEDTAAVSSKKPRKAMLSRDMLYGRFIKSATLMSGGEKPVQDLSSSDSCDSSEDEDAKLDLSSAAKMSDETLMKVCGGRTAHKGARHGLTMSAKLSRIEEQERAFMEKYGKKETKQPLPKSTATAAMTEEFSGDKKTNKKLKGKERNMGGEEPDAPPEVPKKKRRRKGDGEEVEEDALNGHEHVSSMEEEAVTSRRKKRSKVPDNTDLAEDADHKDEDTRRAKKKKKRKTEQEESMVSNDCTEDRVHHGQSGGEEEDKEHEDTGEEARASKKKKKRKTEREESTMSNDCTEDHVQDKEDEDIGEEARASKKKKRNKKKKDRSEDGDESVKAGDQSRNQNKLTADEESDQNPEKRSRKKKKRVDEPKDGEDTEATKKKKKSKSRDRRD